MNRDNNDKTSWDKVAGWYDSLLENGADTYQQKVILPNLSRLVSPRPGLTILDLACGQGFFTRAFAAAGAAVTGADLSSVLVELAKKRSPKNVSYFVASADNLKPIATASVNVVTIVLALQNIENLSGVVSECRRVLQPGGRLILVLNHPAFRIPRQTSWDFDEKNNVMFRRVDGYLSESRAKIDMRPGLVGTSDGQTTVSFHRPLQIYFKALQKYGFAVTRLEEWISHKKSGPGPRRVAEDRARKEFPLFLALEAILK